MWVVGERNRHNSDRQKWRKLIQKLLFCLYNMEKADLHYKLFLHIVENHQLKRDKQKIVGVQKLKFAQQPEFVLLKSFEL